MGKARLGSKPLDWIKNTIQVEMPANVNLSNIEYVNPLSLKPNELNKHFKRENEEYFVTLEEDIKERGILVPIIAKRNGSLLSGHNRLIIALKLNHASVPVQYVESELSSNQEREFIFKDNILRRQLSAQDKENIIKTLYSGEILIDNRGGDRKSKEAKIKSANELSVTLPDRIEKETGIKAGTAKRILAKIRSENDNNNKKEKASKMTLIFKHLYIIDKILSTDSNDENSAVFLQIDEFISSLKRKYQ